MHTSYTPVVDAFRKSFFCLTQQLEIRDHLYEEECRFRHRQHVYLMIVGRLDMHYLSHITVDVDTFSSDNIMNIMKIYYMLYGKD